MLCHSWCTKDAWQIARGPTLRGGRRPPGEVDESQRPLTEMALVRLDRSHLARSRGFPTGIHSANPSHHGSRRSGVAAIPSRPLFEQASAKKVTRALSQMTGQVGAGAFQGLPPRRSLS